MGYADDYVDVPTRIAEFRAQYPEGSLQPADLSRPFWIETISGTDKNGQAAVEQTFICYAAAAYRHPDDPRPGIGLAYEVFPGRTNFTRGSELMNAETSAWGRAIIAVLAADSRRGIASAEEVRNRQAERDAARVERPVARELPKYPRSVKESDAEYAAQHGIDEDTARKLRLAEVKTVRDVLGVKSDGKYRDPSEAPQRVKPTEPEQGWQPQIGDDIAAIAAEEATWD